MAFNLKVPGEDDPAAPLVSGGSVFAANAGAAPASVNGARAFNNRVSRFFGSPQLTPDAAPPATIPATPKPVAALPDIYAGEQRLAPGVHRFNDPQVPGVYAARMADGSLGFTNITDANGQPDFGGGTVNPNGVTARGLRRRMVASSAPTGAWVGDADPVTGAPINMPMQRDSAAHAAMLARMMNGGSNQFGRQAVNADPRANYTYAQNSLHMNPSTLIAAAGVDPQRAATVRDELLKGWMDDPNRSNPDVQRANAAALAQLGENVQDVRQRYYGGGNSMLGEMGGAGGIRDAGGGVSSNALLSFIGRNRATQERAALGAQRNQLAAQRNTIAAKNSARQGLQQFEASYNTALKQNPSAASAMLYSAIPSDLTKIPGWSHTQEGQFVMAQLDQQIQNAAGGSHTGAGLSTLMFDPSDPTNFQIGTPGSYMLGGSSVNARAGLAATLPFGGPTDTADGHSHWFTRQRFSDPWYLPGNIAKLRALQQSLRPTKGGLHKQ